MNSGTIFAVIAVISLLLSFSASATEVEYALEDVGGGQWVCHYTVRNNTLGDPIQQFVIWFEPDLYESLSIVSDSEIGYNWYQDTIEPDPVWFTDGAYRALAWDEGIGAGEYESGFAVRFTYLGGGAPRPQEFDIVDPNEYVSVEAGWTTGMYWGEASRTVSAKGQLLIPAIPSAGGDLQARLNLDGTWMYQNMLESTNSNLTATASIISDPAGNNSYSYSWEFDLPGDVSVEPGTVSGGQASDTSWNFAAPNVNQPQGLSDSGQAVTVRVTITGDDYDNTGSAEVQFGIALLGDVNNDAAVNVADRSIINAFWRNGSAGAFTLLDCDINCDGSVNVADRSIANAVWRGVLGQNSVSQPCPLRPSEPGPDVESAWPTLGADFQRAGLSSYSGPEVGCVKWQFATDGALYTSASIGAAGRVHVACEDGKLYTIDPNDGAQVWVFDANSPMTSSPTVGADGTVYVGCMNGRLYAIDKDGVLRWTYDTGAFIYSTPAIADDGKVFFGSQDGKLYALGADGSELWNFATAGPGQVGGAILASPTIGLDDNVYIAGVYDPKLYALDPNNGSIRWVADFGYLADPNDYVGLPLASPAVGPDGTIYMLLPNPINLYALSPADGSIIWKAEEAILQSQHLAGHWQFEADASDSSGNGRDGTVQGCGNHHNPECFITDPKRENVLNLCGQVDIHGYKGILGNQPRSVSAWINTEYGGNGNIISWGDSGTIGGWWRLGISLEGELLLSVGGGSLIAYGIYPPDGKWHHFAVILDDVPEATARDIKLYIDGHEQSVWPVPPPMPINTVAEPNVVIGPLCSLIDDVRIYEAAVGIDEILGRSADAFCWQRPAIGPDGTIYASYDDNYLRAFNPDGSLKWVKRVGVAGGFTLAVDKDGLIYAASEDGSLYVMNSGGTQIARFEGGDWLSHPVIAGDGTIYLCDVDNKVWAISRDSCDGGTADLCWVADMNCDGIVDLDDVLLVAFDWMEYGSSSLPRAGDANRDMHVDFGDFAAVVAKWLDEI